MPAKKDRTAERMREVYPYKVDLSNCDVEPLRHIQVIQPQTCLMAAGVDDLVVRFISDNAEDKIGRPWEDILDRPLSECLPSDVMAQLRIGLDRPDGFQTLNPILTSFSVNGERVFKNLIAHQSERFLILEIEPSVDAFHTAPYQGQLGKAVQQIQRLTDFDQLFRQTAEIIRKVTGYDRVMVYRFDEDYNGEVIAESLRPGVDSFHGLRYPHTDIPVQARELYLKNRIRIIGNTTDVPARLMSSEREEKTYLDLSLAHGRGVSPVHLEYLGNMGVNSSMSVAIVMDDKLWGLFAMHHYSPIFLDYQLRSFLLFIGQVFSGHLAIQSASRYREETLSQNMMRSVLGEQITSANDVLEGLTSGDFNLLGVLPRVTGSIVCFEGKYSAIGQTPTEEETIGIVDWVREQEDANLIFHTRQLSEKYPPAHPLRALASGILVVFLDPERANWIIWFRPEVSQTIRWAGRPVKQILETPDGTGRLSPRKSFAQYIERVECCAEKWQRGDIDVALALRAHIKDYALRRYSEVRKVNEELRGAYSELESFSYTVSHDLRAPLRAIDGFAEILDDDFGDQLGEEGREILTMIQASVGKMNDFIGDILEMSRVGRASMTVSTLNVPALIQSVLMEQGTLRRRDKQVVVHVAEDFPPVSADERLLRQVYGNLIGNAAKYGKADAEGVVRIDCGFEKNPETGQLNFFVENSGSFVPPEFHASVFDLFSRATNHEGEEGTGVGLAIVKRIVNRHGGDIWIDPNTKGAKFVFTLNANE